MFERLVWENVQLAVMMMMMGHRESIRTGPCTGMDGATQRDDNVNHKNSGTCKNNFKKNYNG